MKKLGVPVLANVAAIFLPMMPDLPIPHTMVRPRERRILSTVCEKHSSICPASARIASASMPKTRRAEAIWSTALAAGFIRRNPRSGVGRGPSLCCLVALPLVDERLIGAFEVESVREEEVFRDLPRHASSAFRGNDVVGARQDQRVGVGRRM